MVYKSFLSLSAISMMLVSTAPPTNASPMNQSTSISPTSPKAEMEEQIEKDDRLFDNTSMARILKQAELLSQSDMVAARKQWTRVIEFMHKPRWFPTAAMVPVSLYFANLADICIKHEEIDDAHELMHASFEFPFHHKKEETDIDAVAARLVAYDKKTGNLEKCRTFLQYAIEKSVEPRRSIYQEWLQKLEPGKKD